MTQIAGTREGSWVLRGLCCTADPDGFFVQGADQRRAKTFCFECPVRAECLADALDNRIEFGVWGGMTERERRALLRRRPEITNWHKFLTSAQENGPADRGMPFTGTEG